MPKDKHVSETPATQWLKRQRVAFDEHPYDYVEHGGALESARQLGVDPHQVAKTLIMEDERGHPLAARSSRRGVPGRGDGDRHRTLPASLPRGILAAG